MKFVDDGGFPIALDREVTINLQTANENDSVEVTPPSVLARPGTFSVESVIHKKKGISGELRLLATSTSPGIRAATKIIPVRDRIAQLRISGPTEVITNTVNEIEVGFAHENGEWLPAEEARNITVEGNRGTSGASVQVSTTLIMRFMAPSSEGLVRFRARSEGLPETTIEIKVLGRWLIQFVLLGAILAAAITQIYKRRSISFLRLRNIRQWKTGLISRVVKSIIAALILYAITRLLRNVPLTSLQSLIQSRTAAFSVGLAAGVSGLWVQETLWPLARRWLDAISVSSVNRRSYPYHSYAVPLLIEEVRSWLDHLGFDTQAVPSDRFTFLLNVKKRGRWRALVGMAISLTITFDSTEIDTVTVEIGGGHWSDKALVGTLSMLILWPLIVPVAFGIWEQIKLPEKVFNYMTSSSNWQRSREAV